MEKAYTGSGDPRRSIELLWGRQEPGRRGPKPRLSTDSLVEAAIALADAEGLAALSMRRVAVALGVSTMSLYTYVPSKAELVDLMYDRAVGEAADPDETAGRWREKLAFVARQRWAVVERHPWFLDLALHRPPLGPNVLRKAEVVLKALDGMGLGPEDTQLVAETLQNYMVGAMQAARDAREVEAQTGLTDEEWLQVVEPLMKEHFDPESFPALAKMSEGRRHKGRTAAERTAAFEFGLQRVLDGLEAYIGARKSGAAGR
jgi:AcrR family transcriptional regulator